MNARYRHTTILAMEHHSIEIGKWNSILTICRRIHESKLFSSDASLTRINSIRRGEREKLINRRFESSGKLREES